MKRLTQYGVRTLDANGDVVDVDLYDGKREALSVAEAHEFQPASALLNAEVGIVVEREVWRSRDWDAYGIEEREFETIYRRGSTGEWGSDQ